MWKLLAQSTAAVFAVCVVVLAIMMKWRTGHVEWGVAFIIAGITAGLFAMRAYLPLRAGLRRHFIRTELARRRQRLRALGRAVNELIQSMARLSPGDLSVYQTILHVPGDGATACVQTVQGSPNHHVLVQMADLKLATPEEFKTYGTPPNAFTSVRYALTPFGRSYLPKLLSDAMKHRALLIGRGAPG